jgi:hypothetical protein
VQDSSDLIDTMLSIMRNKRGSTRVVELAAEVIAADARFNEKVGNAKARSEPGDGILRSIDFAGQVMDECRQLDRGFAAGLNIDEVCDSLSRIRAKIDGFVVP